jgi:putative flavoprotein involved in K+ transport
VRLAIRTPHNILRRSVGGMPSQFVAIAFRHLPTRIVDPIIKLVQRFAVGDLSRYGLPPAPRGPFSQIVEDGQIPFLDVGFIDALKRGRIEIVKAVERLDGDAVVLADGTRITPDAVIAATGYRRGLERLVGDLGLIDGRGRPVVHGAATHASAPGLYFLGYTNPVSGNLRELAIDARRIAQAITRPAMAA